MVLFSLKAVTHLLQIFSYFSVFFFLLLATCYLALSLKLYVDSPECGKFCHKGTSRVLVE